MKRSSALVVALVAGLAALGLASCTPTSGRYIDRVFSSTSRSTHLYRETADLTTGADLDLYTDVYQPVGDTLARRPVIVWVHGGGFKGGNRAGLGDVAAEWAQRGYVTMSISYRLDPGNKCQEVQDGTITDPVQVEVERTRCQRAIFAAQNDAFAAIGWIRRNADRFRVDPNRIAVGGSSAGAVTALNVAQRANPGNGTSFTGQKVSAALAMSGCQYDPPAIDRYDAPIAMIASGRDISVPFECSVATVDEAKRVGTPTVANYWPSEAGHAKELYRQHQAEIDRAWTAFLYTHLKLTQP